MIRIATGLTVMLLIFALLAPSVSGYVFRSEDEIYMTGNFEEDMFLFGSSVNFDGTLRGDILASAWTTTINGDVDGSIMVAGRRVTINGDVRRSVRVAGQFMSLNSVVEGDLVAFGQEVYIANDAMLMRDAAIFGAEIILDGVIEGDCELYGGTVTISGRIDGNAKVHAEKITISTTAVIEGNLEYKSPTRAKIAPEAQILGEVKYRKLTRSTQNELEFPLQPPPSSWIWSFLFFCGTFIIGLILILFKRDVVERVATDMKSRFVLHGLVGLLLIFLVPVLLLLVAISVIGLPLAGVGVAVYFIVMVTAKIFVGITLGMVVISLLKSSGRTSLGWSLLLGMLILSLLFKIPVLGWIVYLAAWAIGAGAMTFCFFRPKVVAASSAAADTSGPSSP